MCEWQFFCTRAERLFCILQPLWRAAVYQFERCISSSELEVAAILKRYIGDVQDNPQQVAKSSCLDLLRPKAESAGGRRSVIQSMCCFCV